MIILASCKQFQIDQSTKIIGEMFKFLISICLKYLCQHCNFLLKNLQFCTKSNINYPLLLKQNFFLALKTLTVLSVKAELIILSQILYFTLLSIFRPLLGYFFYFLLYCLHSWLTSIMYNKDLHAPITYFPTISTTTV